MGNELAALKKKKYSDKYNNVRNGGYPLPYDKRSNISR
jgi:hypothetical protein